MSPKVTLTVMDGSQTAKEYVYDTPARCVAGRAPDCEIRLDESVARQDTSRHHCEFAIEPPEVRVRDLGSLNGTFVNDELIGMRGRRLPPEAPNLYGAQERMLHDGDSVRVGHVVLRVGIRAQGEALGAWHL